MAEEDPLYGRAIDIRYLGNGGYFISRGDDAILTAPHYSNPHWLRVWLWTIRPDTVLIDRFHPRMRPGSVAALLIGHAHYDHLLDVPYIARKYHPRAQLYGSRTARNLTLALEPGLKDRFTVLSREVSRNGKPGKWHYLAGGRMRFMALAAEHGPHVRGIHLMKGRIEQELPRAPRSAWFWKEGETLAYLIDFLDGDGQVDYRIYYCDSATPDSTGFPPTLPQDENRRIDLAILSVGSAYALKEYPETFMQAWHPRQVLLGHWENFFRSPARPLQRLVHAHVKEFIRDIEPYLGDDAWLLPYPGSTYRFLPAN